MLYLGTCIKYGMCMRQNLTVPCPSPKAEPEEDEIMVELKQKQAELSAVVSAVYVGLLLYTLPAHCLHRWSTTGSSARLC